MVASCTVFSRWPGSSLPQSLGRHHLFAVIGPCPRPINLHAYLTVWSSLGSLASLGMAHIPILLLSFFTPTKLFTYFIIYYYYLFNNLVLIILKILSLNINFHQAMHRTWIILVNNIVNNVFRKYWYFLLQIAWTSCIHLAYFILNIHIMLQRLE